MLLLAFGKSSYFFIQFGKLLRNLWKLNEIEEKLLMVVNDKTFEYIFKIIKLNERGELGKKEANWNENSWN